MMDPAYEPVSAESDTPPGTEMKNALHDPYPGARDEVRDCLRKLQEMHEEWRRLIRSVNTADSERFQFLHAEILGELQGVSEDLEGISLAIKAVEDNRKSFPVDDAEISRRRDFLRTSRASLTDIQTSVKSPQTTTKIEADRRDALAAKAAAKAKAAAPARGDFAGAGAFSGSYDDVLDNEAFLGSQRFEQQHLRAQQDDFIMDVGKSAARMKEAASAINVELAYQSKLLDEVDEDIERETEHLNTVMKNVGRLLKTSDKSQLYVIIALAVLFFVLLFFVIV